MEADERALKAVKMRGCVQLGTQLHADWPVLVAFCDEILHAIGALPAEDALSYPSLDLCEILEEVMANFTQTRYSGGQVMVHKGTTTMGIHLLSSGSAVSSSAPSPPAAPVWCPLCMHILHCLPLAHPSSLVPLSVCGGERDCMCHVQ